MPKVQENDFTELTLLNQLAAGDQGKKLGNLINDGWKIQNLQVLKEGKGYLWILLMGKE